MKTTGTYNFNAVEVREKCIKWLRELGKTEKFNKVVLGISGGKDSTVAAALCVRAFGKENVHGILMPNGLQKDMGDSVRVCEALGIGYDIININEAYNAIFKGIGESITTEAAINIAPRLRMTTLYAWGQSNHHRVCGTGNASEGLVGYTTKFGDSACDFNPLGDLTTVEVVAIGETMKEVPLDLVKKTPSDGLCGKSDEENLGITYLDIHNYIRGTGEVSEEVVKRIESKMAISGHKKVMPPVFKWQ